MKKLVLVMVLAMLLAGCGAAVDTSPLMSDVTQTVPPNEPQLSFTVDSITLRLNRPENWEVYQTDYGLVLAEYISSVATDGLLNGLLTHIFVPPPG